MTENNLPKGWEEVELSFLVDYKKGKKPKRMENKPFDNSMVYLDIRAIEKKNDEIFVDAETSNATDEDELVIVWDGARAGWVGKSRKGALGSTLMGLKPKIDRDYLYRFIQTQFDYLQTNHRGTGIPHVDPDIFWNIKVPIAPEKEQQRIVAKLDELMEKIDRSRARLERIPQILKRFRQSVLSAAVSGTLTEEWRNTRFGAKGDTDDLPFSWQIKAIETLASSERGSIQSGPFGSNLLHSEFQKVGVLAIGIDNVLDGKFSMGRQNRISLKKYEELKKYTARPLDVLVTVMATVGRCCVVPENLETAIITKHVYRISCDQQVVNPFFLLHCLRSSIVDDQIRSGIQGVTRPGINGSVLKQLLIPIPSLDEQSEILRQIFNLFSIADKIETRYMKATSQLDKLPQSVLAKAFRGELVSQNENDEPANILLERIKAQTADGKSKQIPITRKHKKQITMELYEVLQKAQSPLTPKDVWQMSRFKNDIDSFYNELKKEVKDLKRIKESKDKKHLELVK
jgi:type I restriction enzyme S subunit